MNPFQAASLDRQVTGDLRTDCDTNRIVVLHQLSGGNVFTHSAVQLELDTFRLQDADATVDDVLA